MPSGKKGWSDVDTSLFFAERTLAAMRVAVDCGTVLQPGQRRGMALHEPIGVKMPDTTWYMIAQPMRMIAAAHELLTTVEERYHDGHGIIRVSFARRRGTVQTT